MPSTLPRCAHGASCRSAHSAAATTALRLFVDHGDQTLGHVCTDIGCDSNEGHWKPLPFYIVDEDIYDLAPSVLLGTVDKLALSGTRAGPSAASTRCLARRPGSSQPMGASTSQPKTASSLQDRREGHGGRVPPPTSPESAFSTTRFPSLIVQDEAHLLDESLGTFAGLFESTLDAVFEYLARPLAELVAKDSQGRRRRAKVIAASATVSDPERQLEHLYQRSIPATQFPEPGPSLYESFYAKPAEAEEPQRKAHQDIEVA